MLAQVESLVSFSEILMSIAPMFAGCEVLDEEMADVSGGMQVSESIVKDVSDNSGTIDRAITDVEEHWSSEDSDFLLVDELIAGEEMDVDSPDLSNVFDELSRESATVNIVTVLAENCVNIPNDGQIEATEATKVSMPGLRALPDPGLADAGKGKERLPSENNDKWASKRANDLRKGLGWDMSIGLGDLPLRQLDELLSNLFSRVVKVDGTPYPSSTLMNMCNGFNRIIRRASDIRSLTEQTNLVERDFNINSHPAFAKTRMVVVAAIKKSAKEGLNKKRLKSEILTEEHEKAILADIDHQVTSSHGCQKRLAFFFLVRLGIRGGMELWNLHRDDIIVCIDRSGKEYVKFEERLSKNNNYSMDRYSEEQFRNVYHSYEDDFVMTVTQYKRHLPCPEETEKPDLFMQAITNPVSIVWYNKCQKVGKGAAGGWLKNMALLVGLPPEIFTNRSGRATLVTRMAAKGVPDEVGMAITGHRSTGGYKRYDRTQKLKMEAAALVSSSPNVDYGQALAHVSKSFVEEELVGSSTALKPLIDRVSEKFNMQLALQNGVQGSNTPQKQELAITQNNQEGPDILRILLLLLSSTDLEDLKRRSEYVGVSQNEWKYFVAYATCFLTNLGNYIAFGDLKIVPGIREEKFDAIVRSCPLQEQKKRTLVSLWEKTRQRIYSLLPGERVLGFPPGGRTAYYSEGITAEEVKLVSEWMKQEGMEPWNTRIWQRESSGNYGSLPEYDLRIASALQFPTKTSVYQNKCVIHVVYGDFEEDLKEVVTHLKEAVPYAESQAHREIVEGFICYIETGSIENHKKCQEIWLNNQNNVLVEFHLGFIETYRDPGGCRAEFEGFVGCVDKVATEQFSSLIEKADVLLPLLPWPKDYEADKFHCPALTCIEVFFYANGTVPAGMNLPNYESVREKYGSRNFCLSNVLESHKTNSKTTFLEERDDKLYRSTQRDVFIVQLAFHELLGHGSGKLFTRDSGGDYNFLRGTVLHPFTDEAVVTCYGPGETWNSIFGHISAAFEECRAECVGIYLSAIPEALEVFGLVEGEGEDIMYINWLMMARAGLLALEYFLLSGNWTQAHMQARFGILRTLSDASARDAEDNRARGVENGSNLLEILEQGPGDLVIRLNRDKIKTVGLPAIRGLLLKLQVYRSTADVQNGSSMFIELTTVPPDMLKLRTFVLANKKPRPMFVQMNTKVVEADTGPRVLIEDSEPTAVGLIQSFVNRFQDWTSSL